MLGAEIMIAATFCLLAIGALNAELPRKVVAFPRTFGNHRARLKVDAPAEAVVARIQWRRRDDRPDLKDVVVTDADANPIGDRLVLSLTNDEGVIAFRPTKGPGVYYAYFMPFTQTGWAYGPTANYNPPKDTADPAWKARIEKAGIADLPATQVEAVESRSEFDAFGPMEQPLTEEETESLRKKADPYLVFFEDGRRPIAMFDRLPLPWKDGPEPIGVLKVSRDEFRSFQLGVWAANQDLQNVAVKTSDFKGETGAIPGTAFRCINAGGTDWLGRSFTKRVDVPKGRVQPLWCGIQIPKDAKAGRYAGTITVEPKNAPKRDVAVVLEVTNQIAENHGDDDLQSMARLRWLDSTIGLDDQVVKPFTALKVKGTEVRLLQRKVVFGPTSLPTQIVSKGHDVLGAPISFEAVQAGKALTWESGGTRTLKEAPNALARESAATAGDLAMNCRMTIEADGHLEYAIVLKASRDVRLDDVRLTIPYRKDAATYFTGLGIKGGRRPKECRWKWNVRYANNMFWLGDVDAGMQCKLKVADTWDLYSLGNTGLPESWDNAGQGGVDLDEVGESVVARAYTGPRTFKAGKELTFKFALLVTPFKPLNPDHWNQRYFHISNWDQKEGPKEIVEQAVSNGATVLNIHQGNQVNPFINYPFITAGELAKYMAEAHRRGIKAKAYYTVRELSNHVVELPALRSLGYEVFADGPGGGNSWLQEHLGSHYAPAWHTPLPDGQEDAAMITVGLSRWHNYYLEGLNWLVKSVGIDGLYLDGIGYDREIMKRVRKVLDRAKPGCLIDFHSGNNFQQEYGLNSCVSGYMEHFPYVDSLWFGEMFDYNESPDYWLVEVSGIPFGLYGEMLQDNGNPWRGMIYGMTARYYSGADPKHIWKLWDEFGIAKARMLGYWSSECPVQTGNPDVKATAYVRKGRTLISLASWAKTPVSLRLQVDWKALGLDQAKVKLVAPAVQGFQEARTFSVGGPIPVEPAKGWLIWVSE